MHAGKNMGIMTTLEKNLLQKGGRSRSVSGTVSWILVSSHWRLGMVL